MSQPATPEVAVEEPTTSSISAAAHAYQVSKQQQSATPPPPPPTTTPAPHAQVHPPDSTKDVVMTDGTPDRPAVSSQSLVL
jgi:COMPASS component SDC1